MKPPPPTVRIYINSSLSSHTLYSITIQFMNDNRPTEITLKVGVSISNTKKIPRKRYGKGFYVHIWIEANRNLVDFRRISYV